jgi:hypothetical protein
MLQRSVGDRRPQVAYKLIEQVMQAQSDLLEIMLTSKQGLHQRLTIAFIQPKPESKKKPV